MPMTTSLSVRLVAVMICTLWSWNSRHLRPARMKRMTPASAATLDRPWAKKAMTELAELAATHDVTLFCENAGEHKRFSELLEQDQPGLLKKVDVHIGYLHRGFVWDESTTGETSSIARPIALLGHHELGGWGWRWLAVDVLWAVVGGLGIGAVLGTLIGRLVLHLRREHKEAVGLDDFLALGLVALAYGLALLASARRSAEGVESTSPVSTIPGGTSTTRIPCGAASSRSDSQNEWTAALLAQ